MFKKILVFTIFLSLLTGLIVYLFLVRSNLETNLIKKSTSSEKSNDRDTKEYKDGIYQTTIKYNDLKIDAIVDKPSFANKTDAMLLFHGTVIDDKDNIKAASQTLVEFKKILDRKDILLISVAYPGENMLIGDNLKYAEASLLWLKNNADKELNINIGKIFLGGHSQGGYLVTRLNEVYQTDGVIANAPGPLNLVYRCKLEEEGKLSAKGEYCLNLKEAYGDVEANPKEYFNRSLLNFTNNYKSDVLFFQGLDDSKVQIYSWYDFKSKVEKCTNCKSTIFIEINGFGHESLFESLSAKQEFNKFINDRYKI